MTTHKQKRRASSYSAERMEWMAKHAHLPPKEALEIARKQWPRLSLPSIYVMRNALRQKGVEVTHAPTGGAHGPAAPAKPKRRYAVPRPLTPQTRFILSLPLDMPIAEAVERAHKAGHAGVSRQIVSAARTRHKARASSPAPAAEPSAQLALPDANGAADPSPVARRSRKPDPVVLPLGALSSDEADFMGLVLGLGYNRAARLLAQFRVQFFETIKVHTTDE